MAEVEVDDSCSEGEESQQDESENLNSSQETVEDERTVNLVDVSTPSPRKARRIGRNYRQTNKNESSSESDKEIHQPYQKSNDSPEKRRKRRIRIRKSSTDENENVKSEAKDDVYTPPPARLRRSHNENIVQENGHHKHQPNDRFERKSELQRIHEGIKQRRNFFDDSMCRKIEKKIDQISEKAKRGAYKEKTYDTAPLRNKYFFGEGYTYGKQMKQKGPGQERLYPHGVVDPIPKWIEKHIIKKLYDAKLVPEGFITSAVINEYFPGGCIVSHIDPIHIFDRPIISISFNSKSFLSFGVRFSFNPIRTSEPILALPLDRGCLTMISGYAADNVTHCIRPQDITERRCVIILRRTFPDAPRIDDEDYIPKAPLRVISTRFDARSTINKPQQAVRKRTRTSYYGHDQREEDSAKRRKTRHSY